MKRYSPYCVTGFHLTKGSIVLAQMRETTDGYWHDSVEVNAVLSEKDNRIAELESQLPVVHDLRENWDDWPRHNNPVLCKRWTTDGIRYSVMHHEDYDWIEVFDDYCVIRHDVIAWQDMPRWEVEK